MGPWNPLADGEYAQLIDVENQVHKKCKTTSVNIWKRVIWIVNFITQYDYKDFGNKKHVVGVAEIPKQEISNSETIG